LLPTIGGQTGLNLALDAAEAGVLDRYGVELIGAKVDAIKRAEDRDNFKATMRAIGLDLPRSGVAHTLEEAEKIRREIGLPVILRASRTLGGTGGNFASSEEEFRAHVAWGLEASPISEILIEESIAGWKEFELEVMRDGKDNVVIVCSIENFDAMGVHTGDSITVAPAQTLTDKEYQVMRDAAVAIIRAIGVDTGGSNIQFALHPGHGPHGRDRDEPARLAQLGAGVQGHRLPDRQDRRQAGRRLHARRAAQRHHARDAGVLRAHDRLRGHQDPALHLREVPAGERHAGPADEVGGRGHGDRPHHEGVAAEGHALARDRQRRLRAASRRVRGDAGESGSRCRMPTVSGTSARPSGAA
jgi:hypothetical protein